MIYLRAEPATLISRLAGNMADRPSLTGADPLVEVEAVFARRDPDYLRIADEVVETDALTPEQVVDLLAGRIGG